MILGVEGKNPNFNVLITIYFVNDENGKNSWILAPDAYSRNEVNLLAITS